MYDDIFPRYTHVFFSPDDGAGGGGGEEDDLDKENTDDDKEEDLDDDSSDDEDDSDKADGDDDDKEEDPLSVMDRDDLVFETKLAKRERQKANRQAAKLRVELKAERARIAELEANQKSDGDDTAGEDALKQVDTLTAQVSELQEKLFAEKKNRLLSGAILEIGDKKLQLIDPEDIVLEDPEDLEDVSLVLAEVYKQKPHFFTSLEDAKEKKTSPKEQGGKGGGKKPPKITFKKQSL